MDALIQKTVTLGDYSLEYSQYLDDLGFKLDGYSYVKTQKDGSRVAYPGVPPFRVKDYQPDTPIDLCNVPTKKQMLLDLREFILNAKNDLSIQTQQSLPRR